MFYVIWIKRFLTLKLIWRYLRKRIVKKSIKRFNKPLILLRFIGIGLIFQQFVNFQFQFFNARQQFIVVIARHGVNDNGVDKRHANDSTQKQQNGKEQLNNNLIPFRLTSRY